jgi:hypothetical protein
MVARNVADARRLQLELTFASIAYIIFRSILTQERIMDELVKLVSSKVGIPEAQAKEAVDVVLIFLKERLPEPIAKQVDAALEGGAGSLGDIAGGLGGMFGKK